MARDLQLHVQLRHTGVWRRIVVPGHAAFVDLHEMLQAAMGWENAHLYAFRQGRRLIAVDEAYEPLDGETPPVADDVGVAEHLGQKGARCEYEYDFGDGWVLDLVVEALVDAPEDGRWILDGALAGPPEDCGGVPGYERLCAACAAGAAPDEEDEDEELDGLLEWVGDWRPDRFDPEAAMVRITHAGVGAREWAGAERDLPFYLRDEDGRAERVRACLWVDVDTGMILTAELNVSLKDALDRVIGRFGSPPSRVLVEGEEDRHRLRFAFPAIEVKPLAAGALDELFASLMERFGDVGIEPRYLEPGGSPRAVEAFFAAMTALHRAAPWERLGERHYLALRAPALDVDVVVSVVGAGGIAQGLVVYASVDCAERFVRAADAGARARDCGGRVLNLTYAPRADLSPAMRKERERHGWSHPRGSAPHVIALDPDGVIAPVFDADYRLAILAARATCAVMERVDELEAGALSLRASVELPDEGSVEIQVAYPVPALEAMDAELDEAELEDLAYDPDLGPDPRRWLAMPEEDRIAAVLAAHRGTDLGESPNSHAAMHAIIETQLALDDPPGARQGFARLRADGLVRHEAIHALAAVLSEHLFRALSKNEELDVGALDASLASASAAGWRASMAEPPRRRRRSGPHRRRKKRKR